MWLTGHKALINSVSRATTACPKVFFRASWRVDDAMVGRGNAGGRPRGDILPLQEFITMTSRRKDWERISAESYLIPHPHPHPHPHPATTQSVKGLNCTLCLSSAIFYAWKLVYSYSCIRFHLKTKRVDKNGNKNEGRQQE